MLIQTPLSPSVDNFYKIPKSETTGSEGIASLVLILTN